MIRIFKGIFEKGQYFYKLLKRNLTKSIHQTSKLVVGRDIISEI